MRVPRWGRYGCIGNKFIYFFEVCLSRSGIRFGNSSHSSCLPRDLPGIKLAGPLSQPLFLCSGPRCQLYFPQDHCRDHHQGAQASVQYTLLVGASICFIVSPPRFSSKTVLRYLGKEFIYFFSPNQMQKYLFGASLVVQWIRICLPRQRIQV